MTATLSESIQFLTTNQGTEGLRSENVFWFSGYIVTQDFQLKLIKVSISKRKRKKKGGGGTESAIG